MILKTNTATRIPVGPLVDPGDFKTAETGLTVTGLSVQIYQTKNDGTAVVRTQITPSASGGSNDMALVTDSTDGMYDLELTAAQLNWLGNGRITFYDVDGFIVHWIDIQVVSAAYFDWIFGTTIPDVNVTKVNGTSQTAKDLGASITQTGDVYPVATNATYGNSALKTLIDTTGVVLTAAGIDAIFDRNSSLSISFENLINRSYQLLNNKMNVTDATGVVALRAIGDGSTIATSTLTDNLTTTTRAEVTWS